MNSLAGIDMDRIILDLSNEVIKQLDDLEVQRNLPRTELLREAVEQYLERQQFPVRKAKGGRQKGEVVGVDDQCKEHKE